MTTMTDPADLIARTLRVPALPPAGGNAAPSRMIARQLDAALLSVGFTCSRALLENLAVADAEASMTRAVTVLAAARRLVGDHVRHNAYFRDFLVALYVERRDILRSMAARAGRRDASRPRGAPVPAR